MNEIGDAGGNRNRTSWETAMRVAITLQHHIWFFCYFVMVMVLPLGVEPRLLGLQPRVLPLDDGKLL